MADLDLFDDKRRQRITVPGYQSPEPPPSAPPADPFPVTPQPRVRDDNPFGGGYRPGDPKPTPADSYPGPVEGWDPRSGGFGGGIGPDPRIEYAGAAPSREEARRRLEASSRGIPVTDQDVDDALRVNLGETYDQRFQGFAEQYARRAAPTEGRSYDSQNPRGAGGGAGPRSPSIPNTNQFRDPVTQPSADFANWLANFLRDPPGGSGNQLLEQALRELAAQFRGGGFTPAEQEVLQSQAINPIERLRQARRQQALEQLARRGIRVNPNAPEGIAKELLDNVDQQFDQFRTQQQTALAAREADERRQRMLQSIQLLSGLAGNEANRLGTAYQYSTVPIGLADRAFNQAMQVYGQANPMALFNPAMQMTNLGLSQNANFGNALAQIAWWLLNGRN